ncbi:MAG: DegV family protein [Anaerolineae bacterium]|nr:DegV family protein [Anaerolineae bacterium]
MVRIVTDTTAGLAGRTARRYDIPVIPQVIIFGSDAYLEGQEIDHATFMKRLTSSEELPKTSAPPPELFVETFERLVPGGEPILCLHPSTELSGTVRSATVAAADFPEADIRIIDTRVIGSPLATMVTLAAQWAEAGSDVDAIEERIRGMMPRSRIYFLVDTLEYLAKNGRIGGAAALLGSVLQVKPILTLRDGRADQFERTRTRKRAVARLKELVLKQMPGDGSGHLSIMHAAVPDQAQALADDLCQALGLAEVPILDVPPAIVTHAGPGVLAVAFFVSD